MKFQNPSFKIFLNGRTDGQALAICSPLFQSCVLKNEVYRDVHFSNFCSNIDCGYLLEPPH